MSITYTLTSTDFGTLNMAAGDLLLSTPFNERGDSAQLIFTANNASNKWMTVGPNEDGSNTLTSDTKMVFPDVQIQNLNTAGGVITTNSTGNLVQDSYFTYNSISQTLSVPNLSVNGNVIVNSVQTVLIEDPIVQIGLSNIGIHQDTGLILSSNAQNGSNIAIGYSHRAGGDGNDGVVIGRTTYSASATGQLFDPTNAQSANVYIYGKLTVKGPVYENANVLASQTFVTSQGYITSSALSGYATESFVTSQGYITSSALSGYATESYVDNKLPVYSGTNDQHSNLVAYNYSGALIDTGVPIDSISGGGASGSFESLTVGADFSVNDVDGLQTSNASVSNVLTLSGSGTVLSAPNGALVAKSVVSSNLTSNTAAFDIVNTNELHVNALYATGGVTMLSDASVSGSLQSDATLTNTLNVTGNATLDGVTTVSVLKFTPGGIDPQLTSATTTVSFASGVISVGAAGVTYGSNTLSTATGSVTGLSVTGLAPNAHVYLYVNGSQSFVTPTDPYTYLGTPFVGTGKAMYHIFNVGGKIFVDMTQVN